MARSPAQIVEEQQSKEILQDMKETQSAQDAAATETVPGDALAMLPPAPLAPPPGDPRLEDEEPIESDPELLGKLQDPHRANRPEVKTAVFTNAYGGKVRAAV